MLEKSSPKIGLWSAIFLGIGSMIGAGIFALLGEASVISGNQVYLSFILGGIIALLSGYSFAKLAQRYPSRGGLIEYLTQSYGEGFFSGIISILFYISSLIAIAMVAKTFGIYSTNLFGFEDSTFNHNVLSILLLFILVGINLAGTFLTSKIENIIVIFKLIVLFSLGVISIIFIKPENLSVHLSAGITNIFYSIGLTFFAFEGFRVITNTIEDLKNPKEDIMKAMIYSILIVMLLYVIISLGVFGTFSLAQVQKYKEYVLAQAAKSIIGNFGFILIGLTALISTASSVNANLFGISNVTYTMAKKGQLPKEYQRKVYHNYEGLLINSVLILLLLFFFNLTQIAIIGSISILIVHFLVHVGHLIKIKQTNANIYLILLAIISTISVIILILIYTQKSMPEIGWYLFLGILLSFLIEVFLRVIKKRVIKKQII